ncbi:hypothetical protein PV343_03670 [Streptomyces sp. WI03-4A]|uniref:hypothetical protein n=1 Tax=Streptomyces sp. WI03-4A TaxID=3028706 RepID=UPI0029B2F01A|nr:hypothetical protein [Streptomyces sp. WI03-4A]MDX2591389.1 hypothetical protein [Streptomyces sp. WI03-4A]
MPALRTESEQVPSQATPLTALLAQACHTVLDGHISAVGAGLASAAHTLLTCDDDGRPQPVAQTAAAGPARRTRHIALADLRGWPLYSVESARLTLHLTIPAPPGPDNVLHPAIPTSTATATMTATIRLSTRPGPPPLADELVAAALTPAPPTTDRTSAPARRAVAAFRHLPSLYRSIERLNTQAPGHRAATASVRAAQDLAAAVCTWCAGGPPVDPRLITHAPHPENLDPNAPPALIALATAVSKLVHQIEHGSSTPES